MKMIRVIKKPKLKSPVLVAAWPGMGDVALKAALFLKEKLKAQLFAELVPHGFFHQSSVLITNGLIQEAPLPAGSFYYAKHPKKGNDLIIFISEAQPFLDKGPDYARQIIEFVLSLKVSFVYTFAAMPVPIEHTQIPKVMVAATCKEVLKEYSKMNIKSMSTGQISGLNGLLLGVAKERSVDGICLLGEIPLYTIQIENPLTSMAILTVFSKVLKISLDFSELKRQAERINTEIESLIDYLKNPPKDQPMPIDQSEIDVIRKGLARKSLLPESVRQRVEKLFATARRDLAQASKLKQLLDEWSVYEQYEDRFLDLFKKSKKEEN